MTTNAVALNLDAVDNTGAAFQSVQKNLAAVEQATSQLQSSLGRLNGLDQGDLAKAWQNNAKGIVNNAKQIGDGLNSHATRGARALEHISFAAVSARGGLEGIVGSVGHLGQAIGEMSGKEDGWFKQNAMGLGMLGGLTVTAISLWHDALEKLDVNKFDVIGKVDATLGTHLQSVHELKDLGPLLQVAQGHVDSYTASIQRLASNKAKSVWNKDDLDELTQKLANSQADIGAIMARQAEIIKETYGKAIDAAKSAVDGATDPVTRFNAQMAEFRAEAAKAVAEHKLTQQEADKQVAGQERTLLREGSDYERLLAKQSADIYMATTQDIFTVKRLNAASAYQEELQKLSKMKVTDEERKQILLDIEAIHKRTEVAIDEEQKRLNNNAQATLLTKNDSFATQYQGRLQLIEQEKAARIKSGVDVAIAEKESEQAIYALRKESFERQVSDLTEIVSITNSAHNERTKAAHNFAKNVLGAEMAVEAGINTVRALREGAEAVASAAHGDFGGAALHAVAALDFTKAAMVAGAQAGGGSNSGGGGNAFSASSQNQTQSDLNQGKGTLTVEVANRYMDTADPAFVDMILQIQKAGSYNNLIIRNNG